MRTIVPMSVLISCSFLSACIQKGSNPADPYESINRETHKFNMAFDATFLKPPAKLYKAAVPGFVRAGINNAYNNVNMLPTVANDLLQAEWNYAIKDSWRFVANTTIGVGGIFDVASHFSLPPHSNDLGLTFAKWGDRNSPYIVIPFLGPSTIRDGMGMFFDFTLFTPYPYIKSNTLLYSLIGLRYVDLRSQMLDNDPLIAESLDKYSFIRDAYLQHRTYLLTGAKQSNEGSLYVDDDADTGGITKGVEKPPNGTPTDFPLTTAQNNAPHRPATA